MTPERARRLDMLGFIWATTDPRHIPWDQRLQELITYKEKWGKHLLYVFFVQFTNFEQEILILSKLV
jgi:hypothetical protein